MTLEQMGQKGSEEKPIISSWSRTLPISESAVEMVIEMKNKDKIKNRVRFIAGIAIGVIGTVLIDLARLYLH